MATTHYDCNYKPSPSLSSYTTIPAVSCTLSYMPQGLGQWPASWLSPVLVSWLSIQPRVLKTLWLGSKPPDTVITTLRAQCLDRQLT